MNAGSCTGIPEGVAALSLSIAAILPGADGFLKAWPTGTTEPLVSQLNFLAGEVVANAAIVPVDAFDRINILANVTTHIYVDVNGYFTDTLNTETNLWLEGSSQAQVVYVANLNTTIGGGISAIRGLMFTSQAGASGVVGEVVSSGATHGVTGKNTSAAAGASGVRGVIGAVPSLYKHAGVRGESSTGATGVLGLINNSQGEAVTGFLLNNTNGAILSGGHLGFHAGNRPCHNR